MDSAGDLLVETEVAAEEAGLELGIDAEQVVHDQHLAVAMSACADADGGNMDALRDYLAKGGGYLLEHKAKGSGFFEQKGVLFEFFGFLFFACPYSLGPEFIDGLWRKTQVAHDGNAGCKDPFHGLQYLLSAFYLDTMGARFFHYADGGSQGFF